MDVKLEDLFSAYKRLNYPIQKFNLGAIRMKDRNTNRFNDLVFYLYDDPETPAEDWSYACYWGTTRPGFEAILDPTNPRGAAIMKSGFYPNAYRIGFHKGDKRKPAFVQNAPMLYYRDNNKDRVIDLKESTVERGVIGSNLHTTSEKFTPKNVDDWSRGCIVVQRASSLAQMLAVAKLSGQKSFNFSLFLEDEIIV